MKKPLKNNIVVLFDIDHTLFNTVVFVNNVFKDYSDTIDRQTFENTLEDVRVNLKQILNEKNTLRSKVANSLWHHANSKDNLYEETIEVLEELSKFVEIGIFSKGNESFQKEKIKSVFHFLNNNHIHVTLNKYKTLPELIKKYKSNKLIFVDDILEVLYYAKRANKDVFTAWIRRKEYHESYLLNQDPIDNFAPDLTIYNLKELIPVIKKIK